MMQLYEYTILKSGYLNPSSSILCLMIIIIAIAVYPVCLKGSSSADFRWFY